MHYPISHGTPHLLKSQPTDQVNFTCLIHPQIPSLNPTTTVLSVSQLSTNSSEFSLYTISSVSQSAFLLYSLNMRTHHVCHPSSRLYDHDQLFILWKSTIDYELEHFERFPPVYIYPLPLQFQNTTTHSHSTVAFPSSNRDFKNDVLKPWGSGVLHIRILIGLCIES